MTSTVAFIGLGHMGGPMAANLVKAGHRVLGFDLVADQLAAAAAAGVEPAVSAADAATPADVVITMLPAGGTSSPCTGNRVSLPLPGPARSSSTAPPSMSPTPAPRTRPSWKPVTGRSTPRSPAA